MFLQITKLCLLATKIFETEQGSEPCATIPLPCLNEWRTEWVCLEQPEHSQLFVENWDYRFTVPGQYVFQLSSFLSDEGNSWQGVLTTDTFLVGEKPDLYNDFYTVCIGESFLPLPGTTLIFWDTLPTTTQTYRVVTTNEFCSNTETILVTPKNCLDLQTKFFPPAIYVPNAFSPNGDGINDIFEASVPEGADILLCEIYDRWGGLICARYPWDGAGADGGLYLAKLAIAYNNRIYNYTTEVNLIP